MKSLNLLLSAPQLTLFDGTDYPSAFIPELWANESIAILNLRGL